MGRQNAAYIPLRRSTRSPSPTSSVISAPSAWRQTPDTVPRPGRTASPERRYAGIRSVGATMPNRLDVTRTRDVARRRAPVDSVPSPSASYSTPA